MIDQILLDMDGVLVDFVGGVCRVHNRPSPYLEPSALGKFDVANLWGITAEEFWKPTEISTFWSDLDPTPEAVEIVKTAFKLVGQENVAILTSPSQHAHCFTGKQLWIEKHFPELKNRLIFAQATSKRFLAAPNKLLLDDKDTNTLEFRAAGGRAILLPRPWNALHRWSAEPGIHLMEMACRKRVKK